MNDLQASFVKVIVRAVCVVLTAGIAACDGPSSASMTEAPVQIVPAPRKVERQSGAFDLRSGTPVVYTSDAAKGAAEYFIEVVRRVPGLTLDAARADAQNEKAIRFSVDAAKSSLGAEGYALAIDSEGVHVTASDARGAFYGAVSLWQLASASTASGESIRLPAVSIEDAPRFTWRGLMIDSVRHFQPVDELKRIIDAMALHKLNVLHWHLTDDQGWRLEIKKYPKLTSVGAWRVPAGAGPAADIDPATGRPRLYGGFYTQDEAREIVAYAAARHITVVPEIEMPGHASAAIAAYPELGVEAPRNPVVPADWGIYENLFNVEESTFAFLEDVLTETMAIFPSKYIHVGGDEAVKKQWERSARVQARMKALGVKDAHSLQSYFIQRIEQFLNRHDRNLIGWDEILEGGLAPNATVMSWRGIDGAIAAASAGHDAVLSPWPTLYFDNRPLDTAKPPGRGRVISVEDVYRFDPAPAALTEEQRKHILGVQANVWTEHIRTADRLQYMIFPRLAALSEVAWSPADASDWDSFQARLPVQLDRYQQLGLNYADPSRVEPVVGTRRTSHQLKMCSDKLVLALEDDAPVQGERAVFFVDIMQPCWIYERASLAPGISLRARVGQVPFNFQIGDARNEIRFREPSTKEGELEVRLDGCEGPVIASLPLAPAANNPAVTELEPATLGDHTGPHDLCLTFTQRGLDPTWVIDEVELVGVDAR